MSLERPHQSSLVPAGLVIPSTREGLRSRVMGEYIEMPGLRLTAPQASRLWGLDRIQTETLLADLVASGFLCRTGEGAFRRADR